MTHNTFCSLNPDLARYSSVSCTTTELSFQKKQRARKQFDACTIYPKGSNFQSMCWGQRSFRRRIRQWRLNSTLVLYQTWCKTLKWINIFYFHNVFLRQSYSFYRRLNWGSGKLTLDQIVPKEGGIWTQGRKATGRTSGRSVGCQSVQFSPGPTCR